EAKFGIFYGGQIQERQEMPFEVDPAKQRHGFRLDFPQAPGRQIPVFWEIDQPAPRQRANHKVDGKQRLARLGPENVRGGEQRLDHAFSFEPGDGLGLWNFRVLVEDRLVLDQVVLVYDPSQRSETPLTPGPL